MADRIIRYGIAGCGMHALRGHYLPGLTVPHLQLVSLFDPVLGAPELFVQHEAPNVVLHRDFERFLADPNMDAVVICSPDRFHASQLDAAIVAGKHVLVDKPAAANTADLIQLMATLGKARAQGLVISSCHPRRFNPAYVHIKRLLPTWQERFGALLDVSLDFSCHAPSKRGLHTGLLADHTNHEFDFLNYLLGKSDTTAVRLYDSKVRYAASGIRKADDVTFHFTGTHMLASRICPETIRLRFAKGEVTVYTAAPAVATNFGGAALPKGKTHVTIYDHELIRYDQSSRAAGPTLHVHDYWPETNYEIAFAGIMGDFAEAITLRREPYLSHDDIFANSHICVELTERGRCDIVFPR